MLRFDREREPSKRERRERAAGRKLEKPGERERRGAISHFCMGKNIDERKTDFPAQSFDILSPPLSFFFRGKMKGNFVVVGKSRRERGIKFAASRERISKAAARKAAVISYAFAICRLYLKICTVTLNMADYRNQNLAI